MSNNINPPIAQGSIGIERLLPLYQEDLQVLLLVTEEMVRQSGWWFPNQRGYFPSQLILELWKSFFNSAPIIAIALSILLAKRTCKRLNAVMISLCSGCEHKLCDLYVRLSL